LAKFQGINAELMTASGEKMASLTITRDSGYADRRRAYKVVLDGERIGEIRNGETKEFPIGLGRHALSLKIDWCGSNTVEFVADPDEKPTFQVKSSLRGLSLLFALPRILFTPKAYLLLERTS
jgi:hypothetical protein